MFFRMLAFTMVVSSLVAVSSARAESADILHFRLVNPRTVEIADRASATAAAESLQQLGCEQRLEGHDGHFHLTTRCPEWRQARFANHETAHRWEAWLKSFGFEVQHNH